MKLGFAGTPVFSRVALEALLKHDLDVKVVLTQPDRAAGRGMQMTASPVKTYALEKGIDVLQPRGLRSDGRWAEDAEAARQALQTLDLDVLIVAAYGLILPQWVLLLPRYGCLNIHASLLPRWRGAAPIQRAIEAGDPTTGITIMQMDTGLDTGDMLLRQDLPILDNDTAESLHDRLAMAGGELIVLAIEQLSAGQLKPMPQDNEQATYAAKLQKSEAALDFTQSAERLARRVRAFDLFPGTTIELPGMSEPVKVWQAQALAEHSDAAPGTLLACQASGIDVATGQGTLRLLTLQRPGGKRQPVSVFLQSVSLNPT